MTNSILVAVPKQGHGFKDPKPMRRFNARRRRRALAEDFGDLAVFVRTLPCLVVGCTQSPVDAAHVRSRGAGHHAWLVLGGERVGNIVPLCRAHHDEQGQRGIKTFEANNVLQVRVGWAKPVASLAAAAVLVGRLFEGGPT